MQNENERRVSIYDYDYVYFGYLHIITRRVEWRRRDGGEGRYGELAVTASLLGYIRFPLVIYRRLIRALKIFFYYFLDWYVA